MAACANGNGVRRGRPGTALERTNGFVALEAQYKQSRSDDRTSVQTILLKEEAGLRLRGRIVDSRLLRYDVGAVMAFNQVDSSESQANFENLFLPRYNASLMFLEKHPTPVTLFGSRVENRQIQESRTTTEVIDSITNQWGATLGWVFDKLNGSINFRRSIFDTKGQISGDRSTDQNALRFDLFHNPSSAVRTQVNYWFDTFNETFSGEEYDTHTFSLRNQSDVGIIENLPRFNFWTDFIAQVRSGTVDFTSIRFSEDFFWRIEPKLRAHTRYNFVYFDSDALTRRHSFLQELEKTFYGSLILTGSALLDRQKIDNGTIDKTGVGLNVDYLKEIGPGRLQLRYSFDFIRQANKLGGSLVQILDEAHVLSTTNVTLLENARVIEESVVVTDSAGTITYARGPDFDLVPRGDRTEVVRIPGGLITDGQSVLIDYQFETASDLEFDENRNDLFIQYMTEDLRVYAGIERLRQDPRGGTSSPTFLENRDTQLIGADWNRRGLHLRAEYRNTESTSAPSQQTEFGAGYTFQFWTHTRFGLAATHVLTNLPDGEDWQTTILSMHLNSRPTRRITIIFEPSYRIEGGRGLGLNRDVLNLYWEVRYTLGKFMVRWFLRHQGLGFDTGSAGSTFSSLRLQRQW